MTPPRATPLATPVDLRRQRTTSDRELASRLHPGYREAIGRLPAGRGVFRGLPFRFARATSAHRWLLLDREVAVDLRAVGPASHVVVAHFCDAWRDPVAGRPADLPIGWVTPVGQPLARYTVELESGRTIAVVMRRRFEVNEGIIGWGQGAFAAVAHTTDTPLDWRGPYPAMPAGGYAEPGHAGLLGILPGSWGPAQTGVADSVPSPTGDIALWLHAIEIPDGADPRATADGTARAARGGRRDRGRGGHGLSRDGLAAGPRTAANAPGRGQGGGGRRRRGPWAGVPGAAGASAAPGDRRAIGRGHRVGDAGRS